MITTPLALDEATEICEDFEDLKDTEFIMNGTQYLVNDVVICPHPEQDRQAFIDSCLANGNNCEGALDAYTGSDFDVILFICNAENEEEVLFMTIRTYAAEQGVAYNFPA